jgi:hypothetical protein
MRFLMRIEMPTEAENPEVAESGFNDKMRALLLKVNAKSASFGVVDGRRVDEIIVDVKDATELPGIAEPFFRWLKVKAEFLPELTKEEARAFRPTVEAIVVQNTKARKPGRIDLEAFLNGEVDGADFHHAHHVRAAFELLKLHDFATAAKLFSDGIKAMNARTGNPDFHHMTLTIGFMAVIAERADAFQNYDAFIAACPELLDKAILLRWYTPGRIGTALARRTFLLPDIAR